MQCLWYQTTIYRSKTPVGVVHCNRNQMWCSIAFQLNNGCVLPYCRIAVRIAVRRTALTYWLPLAGTVLVNLVVILRIRWTMPSSMKNKTLVGQFPSPSLSPFLTHIETCPPPMYPLWHQTTHFPAKITHRVVI